MSEFVPESIKLDGAVYAGVTGDDVIIPARHFHLCPFELLTESNFGKVWSWSSGGHPVGNGAISIDVFHRGEDGQVLSQLSADRWVVPSGIQYMLKMSADSGADDKVREIRNGLLTAFRAVGLELR